MNSEDNNKGVYNNLEGIRESLKELMYTISKYDILAISNESHSKIVSDLKVKRLLIHSIVKLFETTVERTRGYFIKLGSSDSNQLKKKDVDKIALRLGYIKEEDQWIGLVEGRNLTAHEYSLETNKMENIVRKIKEYIPTLEEIANNL